MELMARIRVALRHLHKAGGVRSQTILAVDGLRIDFDKHLVYLDDRELHTTPLEYSLLSLFFRNIGKVPEEVETICANMNLSGDWIFYLNICLCSFLLLELLLLVFLQLLYFHRRLLLQDPNQ